METEVKIAVAAPQPVEKRLAAAGFRVAEPRLRETNEVYDTPDSGLRKQGMMLRLRQAGSHGLLTWKGPGEPGPHKSRPEIESTVESIEAIGQIFERLGYRRLFRYEKYRTEYRHDREKGVVTLDETPIGNFIEIEGAGDWIDRTASRLGFSADDYVLESYGHLYLAHCKNAGVEPGDMLFANDAAGR